MLYTYKSVGTFIYVLLLLTKQSERQTRFFLLLQANKKEQGCEDRKYDSIKIKNEQSGANKNEKRIFAKE